MKPNSFNYARPSSLDEAVKYLASDENAKVIAGGLSLMPMLNFRLLKPELLVDISGLDDLRYVKVTGNKLEVGAAMTQNALKDSPDLEKHVPLLYKALHFVGHYQTRNRGTVCGSISHSDPSSELPLTFALLGGEAVLSSKKGKRTVPASEFQLGMLETACRQDEILSAVRFPLGDPTAAYEFDEFARRKGDFAIVSVAAAVTPTSIRLGIGGVADRPTIREWGNISGEELESELNDFAWELGGYSDIHATAKYRRELVRGLGLKTIERARKCL